MRFKSQKETLLKGVQTVHNVVNPRSSLPILSNILIESFERSLRLTATDLDIGVSCVIPVDIQEVGSIALPAKRFGDIIKELSADEVRVTTKKNNMVTIEADNCQFKIMGLPHEEFPKLPEFKDKAALKLDQGILKEMIRLTFFAVSLDESRYILNGILFKLEKNILNLVATDGKRLAIVKKKLDSPPDTNIQVIIPIKTIHELNRNLQEEGELSFVVGNNQALFDLGSVLVISRLIEGEFPDYQQVIPATAEQKIKVDKEQFLLAVRRAALLSTPDYQPIKIEVFKDKMVISKSTPDIGESREELPIRYGGKEVVVGFNPYYLIDVLKNLDTDAVEFELVGADNRGVIRDNGYSYIVMPMLLA